ncbi:response regulator [Pelagicoccus albus]|uniref:Response regulator n=1 Tax=Pelagicoccus albus TaxID=415222 RepID=A0A7X1B3F3_9BACT|nr:response regulator [Pelagicoccus albus]MBC2604945.1 response regulator [Pelagicoccus albus]
MTGPNRRKVLLVDDDPMVLESLGMLFEHYGWLVERVASGDQVLQAQICFEHDFAIVDERMDGVNGLDVIRALKSRSKAPVFMLTGCVEPELREEARRVGADGFFDKPIGARALMEGVEARLRRREGSD